MEQLASVLKAAYSGTKLEREEALRTLNSATEADPVGTLSLLFSVGTNQAFDEDLRVIALSKAKNFLLNDMQADSFENSPVIDEIKEAVMSALPSATRTERRMMLECARIIISEFRWDYFDALLPALSGGAPAAATATAIDALYVMTKRYKTAHLEPDARRLQVCAQLVALLPPHFASADFEGAKLIFKNFECVVEVFMELGTPAGTEEGLAAWFEFLLEFPSANFTEATAQGKPRSVTEQYVKCVKRIGSISFSLLHEAANKRHPSAVAGYFAQNYAVRFFDLWAKWLELCVGQPAIAESVFGKKSAMFALRYIKVAAHVEGLYHGSINPRAIDIMANLMFPFLCFSSDESEVFNDDLQAFSQYIFEEEDAGEHTPRQAACNAISAIISPKKKFQYNPTLLSSLLEVINGRLDPAANETSERVFGFLHLLGVMRKQIKSIPEVWNGHVERLLIAYVVPRLHGGEVYMRTKCLWVCSRFSKAPVSSEDNYKNFIAAICQCVEDQDDRVRLAAINALVNYLSMKRARPYLRQVLLPLVNECLAFVEKVQTPFISVALQFLAENHGPELVPVFDRLVATLVQQFLALAFDMKQAEEQLGDTDMTNEQMRRHDGMGMSALSTLSTINTLVLTTEHNRAVLAKMLPDLVRLIAHVLKEADTLDFMDMALSVYQHMMFVANPVPQECWELFPHVHHVVMNTGVGVDYFATLEAIIDNYVSNATAEFVGNADVMRMTLEMCGKMLGGQVTCADEDKMGAPQLIEAIFHQAKPKCPDLLRVHLPSLLTLLLQALSTHEQGATGGKQEAHVKLWLVTACMDAFYFDAAATMTVLMQSGAYPHFFTAYFGFFAPVLGIEQPPQHHAGKGNKARRKHQQHELSITVKDFLSIHHRKVHVLGLTALLEACTGNTEVDSDILVQAARLCAALIEENGMPYSKRCKLLKEQLENEDEDEEDDYEHEDDDLMDDDEGDIANATGDTAADHDDESDDDADEGDGEETDDYISPIDDVCEVSLFIAWCVAAASRQDPVIQAVSGLNRDELQRVEAAALQYMQLRKALQDKEKTETEARIANAVQPQ